MVIGRLRSDDIYNQVSYCERKEGTIGEYKMVSQVSNSTMEPRKNKSQNRSS